jgi:hypothetical protein
VLKEGYVNTVLRKDGTVVTLTPTGEHYDLAIDGEHRTVGPKLAADPLGDPEFESIVQELKKDLERLSSDIVGGKDPDQPH